MCWQDSDMTVEELPLFCMTTPLKYIFLLPGKPASAAPLPSRVGCRCAGTSRPIHRSKAEAGAPSRSTADSALPAPVLLRFHFNTAEGRRERWFSCCRFQRRMWTEKVRGRGPGGGTDNSSPRVGHAPTVVLHSWTTEKIWIAGRCTEGKKRFQHLAINNYLLSYRIQLVSIVGKCIGCIQSTLPW